MRPLTTSVGWTRPSWSGTSRPGSCLRWRPSTRCSTGWTGSIPRCTCSARSPRTGLARTPSGSRPSIAAGREVGPLAGVPTGVKDLIYTKGIRTASGSHAYADFVPDDDDVVVERITAAGAIVIGKTQVPEFGYSGTGQTPLAEPTAQPVEPGAHLGRLVGRLRRRGGHRGRAVLAGQRRRRLGPHPGQLLRGLRDQADHGPGAAVARHQGRALPGSVELGVAGTHRAADPHRRRRRARALGDRRLRRPGPAVHPLRRRRLAAGRGRRPARGAGGLQPGPGLRRGRPGRARGGGPGGHACSSATWGAPWSVPTPAGTTRTRRCCR